jgi:hypothetical protein
MPGRPRGSKNKSSLEYLQRYESKRQELVRRNRREQLDEPTDPFEVMWQLCMDKSQEPAHRIQAGKELMRYRYPTMRSIEVNAAGEAVDRAGAREGQLMLAWDADAA